LICCSLPADCGSQGGMFQAVGDLVTLKWVREHPIIAGSVAFAAAAVEYALSGEEPTAGGATLQEQSLSPSKEKRRTIAWEDERGGKLVRVQTENNKEPEASESACDADASEGKKRERLQPKMLKFQNQMQSSTSQLAAQGSLDDSDSELEDTKVGAGPSESPQWGWFVTFTPPQPQFQGRDGEKPHSASDR